MAERVPAPGVKLDPSAAKAYIALGANLGERRKNLEDGIGMLGATPGVRVTAVSSFLENAAVGGPADSPAFLNAVAEVDTSLSPIDLLHRLLDIERALGRIRREKWGPRTIDLDLLLYADEVLKTPELTLPHPRLAERQFVLQPLAEIAPSLVVPGSGKRVDELLQELG
jgi:2-amino-4-hydroxy-6-hydroxymethyldihydropteridine diphosphokinase